jgi:uracil-DNA glycosylase family protein
MNMAKRVSEESAPALEPNPALMLLERGVDLDQLREASQDCKACPLYLNATQVVFGQGMARNPIMLVGEQPGDHEDREGSPFVGAAGEMLWKAVAAAGIDQGHVYATNAVKHFKWTAVKWKRLHAKPNRREVNACLPWLEAEVALLDPSVIVGLGATACQAMLGSGVRITKDRGKTELWMGHPVVIAFHPSAILRGPDEAARAELFKSLVNDLKTAHGLRPAPRRAQ